MTFPKEIHRGADSYSLTRLEKYDLSVARWKKIAESTTGRRAEIALPRGGGARIGTEAQLWPDGSMYFYTRKFDMTSTEFDSAADAIACHELLANDIVERIETMEQLGVDALMDGAL